MNNTTELELKIAQHVPDEQVIKHFGLANNTESDISLLRKDMGDLKKKISKNYPKQHQQLIEQSKDFMIAYRKTCVCNTKVDVSPLNYLSQYVSEYSQYMEPFVFATYLQEPFQTLFIKHFIERK